MLAFLPPAFDPFLFFLSAFNRFFLCEEMMILAPVLFDEVSFFSPTTLF